MRVGLGASMPSDAAAVIVAPCRCTLVRCLNPASAGGSPCLRGTGGQCIVCAEGGRIANLRRSAGYWATVAVESKVGIFLTPYPLG